jgi:zinc transporter
VKLGAIRRMLVTLQRLLAPPAALFRLLNRPPVWIGSDDVQALRESAEELAVADRAALANGCVSCKKKSPPSSTI